MDLFFIVKLLLSLGSIAVLSLKIAMATEPSEPSAEGDTGPAAPFAPGTAVRPNEPAQTDRAAELSRLRWALMEEDAGVRLAAASELALMEGAEPVRLLAGLVKDPDPRIRRLAVRRIGAEKDPQMLETLLQAARDVRVEVQLAACEGLIGSPDERAVELFRRLSLQGLLYARVLGVRGLGAAGGSEELIAEIYKNSSGKIREEAIVALSASRAPVAIEAVRGHLRSRLDRLAGDPATEPVDPAQFEQVVTQEPSLPLIEQLESEVTAPTGRSRKQRVLTRLYELASKANLDERSRYLAARGLGFLGGLAEISKLEKLTSDPCSAVRLGATVAIGRLRSEKGLQALRRATEDPSSLVRGAAVRFLSEAENGVPRDLLEKLTADRDPLVAGLARRALEERASPAPSRKGSDLLRVAIRTGPVVSDAKPAAFSLTPPASATTAHKTLENLIEPLRKTALSRTGFDFSREERKRPTLSGVLRDGGKGVLLESRGAGEVGSRGGRELGSWGGGLLRA